MNVFFGIDFTIDIAWILQRGLITSPSYFGRNLIFLIEMPDIIDQSIVNRV